MLGLSSSKGLRGASTLEILLAFAVLTLALTAATSLVFGNQSLAADIESSEEALSKAQAVLEDAKALARLDFNLLNPTTSLAVAAAGPYLKRATAQVSWVSWGRPLSVSLSTDIADVWGSESGESCSSVVDGDWRGVHLGTALQAGSSGGVGIVSLLATDGLIYAAASTTGTGTKDFFILNPSGSLLASLNANNLASGINDLALSSTTAGRYLYAASDGGPKIEIIDVSNPRAPVVVHEYEMPTTTPPFITSGRVNALAVRGGYLYAGLSSGAAVQLVVLDISAPKAPTYAGSYAVGAGVSDTVIKHNKAYLATTDNTKELLILDVFDPHTPTLLSSYHPLGSTGFGSGKALAIVGNTLHLARTYDSTGPEWYALNISHPSAPEVVYSRDISTSSSPQSANGVVVRNTLAFLAMRDSLQVWDVATSSAPSLIKKLDLPAGIRAGALACDGNRMYMGGYRASDNKGVIYELLP